MGGGQYNTAMAKETWALVTGASSGIGKEFAVCFASSAVNVVMAARSGAELRKIAKVKEPPRRPIPITVIFFKSFIIKKLWIIA